MKAKTFYIRLDRNHLLEDEDRLNNFLESHNIKRYCNHFVEDKEHKYWAILLYYEELTSNKEVKLKDTKQDKSEIHLNKEEIEVYEYLREWRREKAMINRSPEFMICHNSELKEIVRTQVQSMDDLETIKGFGKKKISEHGIEIVNICRKYFA